MSVRMIMALSVVVVGLGFAGWASAAPGDGLDGTSWTLQRRGIRRLLFWKTDRLLFRNGEFISLSMQAKGFIPGPYAIANAEEGLWMASVTRLSGDQVAWEGKVDGNKMRGEYMWVRPDGSKWTVPWTALLMSPGNPPVMPVAPIAPAATPPAARPAPSAASYTSVPPAVQPSTTTVSSGPVATPTPSPAPPP